MRIGQEDLSRISKVLRKIFPEGCTIEYIGTKRQFEILQKGAKGVVRGIDNEGNVDAIWKDGTEHVLVYGVDFWKRTVETVDSDEYS